QPPDSDRPADARRLDTGTNPLLLGNGKGPTLGLLGGTCDLLGDSCGRPELPRRDADNPLEVTGELALVREAGTCGNLRQGEIAFGLQKLLGSFDAAGDDVLMRRQPGGRLELPREVVDAQMGRRGHVLQGQTGVQVLLDVLDNSAELPLTERTVRPTGRGAGGGGVADQVDSEKVGQGLGGEP